MGIDSTESFTKKEATIKNTMHAHNFHIGDSMVKEPALYQVYQGLYATKYLYKLNVFSKRNCGAAFQLSVFYTYVHARKSFNSSKYSLYLTNKITISMLNRREC